jgi:hypothetical protein
MGISQRVIKSKLLYLTFAFKKTANKLTIMNHSKSVPMLMPHQMEAFNGDTFAEKEFLKLKAEFGIVKAVETGTCFGSTTIFLAKNFGAVCTIEINKEYLSIAVDRFVEAGVRDTVKAYLGDSSVVLADIIKLHRVEDDTIFFLDAHWNNHCPLLEELAAIASAKLKPVIVIHDFKVPNEPELGFDSYDGQPFTYEWIKVFLDVIYGLGGYGFYYNTSETSTEIKRGIIYITPK